MHFILFLIVAAICAIIASALVPGRIPGGFLVAMVCGFLGAWIGGNLMGHFGPSLAGVSLIPTIVGSAVLVLCMSLVSGLTHEVA
ncbi:MAG: GlsB/YeaQ/YmgE family stress response membrane protein [Candidatus Eremiobacteraeota bacterium]|nr:GlsB/YeaQ/YmgE family stress response membrane protein [Candidatus Eremiobacteraeota bacterium]